MERGTIGTNDRILRKLFMDSFFVICLMELISSAASLTDSWFIGNFLGSDGMAAMGLAKPIYSYMDILCGPFGLGTQLLCSHYIGKCEVKRAQRVFTGSFTIALLLSLLIGVIGLSFTDRVAILHGAGKATPEVRQMTEDYLRGLFFGAPAMVCFGILTPIVQLGGGKKLITAGTFAQLAADVIGDALSVFVFDGGIFGLGLATAISYYAALIPLVLYFFGKDAIFRLRLSFLPGSDLKEILQSGSSKAIKRVCNTLKPIILNALSLLLGATLAVSAYSITNQVRDLLISFSAGAAGTVTLLGAFLHGQRDRNRLKGLSGITMEVIGWIAGIGLLCIIFAEPIVRFFVSDSQEVIRMAATSVRCVGIMIPFSTFNGVVISFMQITKRYRLVRILSYLNRLILIVVMSALLGWIFGTDGLWWAMPAAEIVNAIVSLLIIRRLNGKFPRNPLDLMCLGDNFGFKPRDYLEITVKTEEDAAMLYKKVSAFCADHGIDQKRSFFTQLAIEELTMNVLKHGFPQCKRKGVIQIWITYDQGELLLRFQDNCPSFNVMKYCSELKDASAEHCVGLRLVSGIAKDMKYVNSFETNNLMITI